MNTDYLNESFSEVFRQLIVSEDVWMEHKATVKPVNVMQKRLKKKRRANYNLVHCKVKVKDSHSLNNNMRNGNSHHE